MTSAAAAAVTGDNEWTDCDRVNDKQNTTRVWNSLNRLSFVRKTFFRTEYSQGQIQMKQEVQVCQQRVHGHMHARHHHPARTNQQQPTMTFPLVTYYVTTGLLR
jgi:hypothetical protein